MDPEEVESPTPARAASGLVRFCVVIGLVLGCVAAFGGFGHFLIVVVLGALGLIVGLVLDGRIDLAALTNRASGR